MTQLIVCITKMDSVAYGQARFEEAVSETKRMLCEVGWRQEDLDARVPFIPLAAWTGDNVVQPSGRMTWWRGCTLQAGPAAGRTVTTLASALNDAASPPERLVRAPFRMPITGALKVKGAGD